MGATINKTTILVVLLLFMGLVSAQALIMLDEPLNNFNTNSQTINFVANINSQENITNASIYGNFSGTWEINETNNSIEGNETIIIFIINLEDGSYEWNIEACDINDECAFSENNYTINVDTQHPQILAIVNITTNETAQINISTNEPANYTLNYGQDENIESEQTNTSFSENHVINLENLLSNITYYFQIITCDEAGNCNTTEILNFTTQETIDNEPPTWLQTPYNFSINNETPIQIQYNASDNIAIEEYFINDEENFTITQQGLLTNATTLTTGNYSLQISVNDTSNNILSQTITITITQPPEPDNEPPTWLQIPYDFTINNETNIAIQYNATDNIDIDSFYIGNSNYFNMTKNGLFRNKTTLSAGNYSLIISVNDTSGNINSTNINIEIIPLFKPSITSVTLSSYEFVNNAAIEINVTVQKGMYDLDTVTVFGVQLNNLTEKNASISQWSGLVNLNDNNISATAIATDTEGFTGTRNSANYIINDTPPKIISPTSSQNYTIAKSSNAEYIFTANKNVTGYYILDEEEYEVYFSNSNQQHFLLLNGSINRTTLPLGVMTNGLHNIIIYLEDDYGNNATYEYNFSIIDYSVPFMNTPIITGRSSSSSPGTATITLTFNEYSNCWISSSSSINANTDGNMSQHTLMTGSPGKTLTRTITYTSSTTITRYVSCIDLLDNRMNGNEEIEFTVTISSSETGGNTNTKPRDPRLDNFLFNQNNNKEELTINSTPPVLQNVSHKKIITLIGAQDLEYNELLRKAIAEILGLDEIDDLFAKKLIETSEEFTKNIEVTRHINITENKTIITTTLINKGQNNLTKFMIYDRVPTQFSTSTSKILVKVQGAQIKIVKENPEYLLLYDEFLPEQIITYSYQVNERKDSSIIDMFSTELYAESNVEVVDVQKKSNAGKIIGIIIWLQIIWISVFLFYYKKHHSKIQKEKQNKKIHRKKTKK